MQNTNDDSNGNRSRNPRALGGFLLVLLGLMSGAVSAEPPAGEANPFDPEGLMAKMVGTWRLDYSMVGDGGTESRGGGIERHRLTVDGRFKVSDFEGTLFGAPYRSHGVQSWVADEQAYVNWYFDASSPEAQVNQGRWDDDAGAMVKWSEGVDFEGRPTRWKQVLSFPGSDTYSLEMFTVDAEGRETKAIVCQGRRLSEDPEWEVR